MDRLLALSARPPCRCPVGRAERGTLARHCDPGSAADPAAGGPSARLNRPPAASGRRAPTRGIDPQLRSPPPPADAAQPAAAGALTEAAGRHAAGRKPELPLAGRPGGGRRRPASGERPPARPPARSAPRPPGSDTIEAGVFNHACCEAEHQSVNCQLGRPGADAARRRLRRRQRREVPPRAGSGDGVPRGRPPDASTENLDG